MGACSIPILIHLFFKRRFHRLRWAAMKFLLAAYRKTKTSLLLENVILLLLRILIIALLVFLFARPAAPEVSKITLSREPDHYILVLDRSYSMGFREDGFTSFEKSKKQVRVIWDNTREKDTVTLITMDEQPKAILTYKEIPVDRKQKETIFQEFEQLQVSEMGVDLPATIDRVKEQVLNKPINKRLFIISDFQKYCWEKILKNPAVLQDIKTIREQVNTLVLVDVGARDSENLGITSLEVDGVVGAGIPARFVATIRNFGEQSREDVDVFFFPQPRMTEFFSMDAVHRSLLNEGTIPEDLRDRFQDEGASLSPSAALKVRKVDAEWSIEEIEKKSEYLLVREGDAIKVYLPRQDAHASQEGKQTQSVSIAPQSEQQAIFFHTFGKDEVGNRHVRVELKEDSLAADNRRYLSLEVLEKIRVLVVDGDPDPEKFEGETDYVMPAIGSLPDNLIQARLVTMGRIGEIDFDEYDVVLIANLRTFPDRERVTALENFVKKGKGVYIWLGDKVLGEYYNDELFQNGMGIMPGEILGNPIGHITSYADRTVFYFTDIDKKHPAWHYFTMNQPLMEVVESVLFYRFFPIRVDPKDDTVSVLAYYNDPLRHPALLERKLGKGKVILCTTTIDPAWNSLHSDQFGHVFVTMVHEFLQYLGAPARSGKNLLIGEPIIRRYEYPVENARLTSPDQEMKSIAVLPGDEYLFSLGDDTDARELGKGFYRLGLKFEDDASVRKEDPRMWTITGKSQTYAIKYHKDRDEVSIFRKEAPEPPLHAGLKARRDANAADIVNVYRIDKKNYAVESQDTDTLQSGMYRLDLTLPFNVHHANRGIQEHFAVNVDPAEGDVAKLSESKLLEDLHSIKNLKYTRDLKQSEEIQNPSRHAEYWRDILLGLLVVMAAEGYLAMWFSRRTK